MSTWENTGTIPEWTLGWRLQRALGHAGIKTQDMAEYLGVTRSTISRWTNDHGAPPRAAYVKQWALMTGVPSWWLLDEEPPDGGPGTRQPGEKGVVVDSRWTDRVVIPMRPQPLAA